ncbi:MAG TPA: carboxypeptidase regulatory-like domain-containing protein, partial [Anseongella sp.]|nr:carboxypeptidase regulatory-like domain-containing protein [Anseongella sp.]
MKRLSAIVFALLVSIAAYAQTPATGKITGAVTDSLSSQPLAFASVSLNTPEGKTVNGAMTGDDGKFTLENVP